MRPERIEGDVVISPTIKAGEIMVRRGGSVNPAKFPDEVFDLLSIPAFDRGEAEVFVGSEIGSSKNCTQENDVLLSKIIPHIRRCWVVPQGNGRRQIGSGEWIIFRSDKFDPNFLKHYLTSNGFHKQFMNTVAGVGGSLVRARPVAVENIEIPLPPLEEQKRIAAILDKADAIRRKRQQAIDITEQLLRSVFLELFGDPVTNPKGWSTGKLGTLVTTLSGATPSKAKKSYWVGDYPWVSPKDMKVTIIKESQDHISEHVFGETNQKKILPNSILIVVRGMILAHTVPIGITARDVAINQDIKAFVPNSSLNPIFLLYCLKSMHTYLLGKVSTAAHGTKRIEMNDLFGVDIICPSADMQQKFSMVVEKYQGLIEQLKYSQFSCENLFNSAIQSAFQGELVEQTKAA